MRFDPLSLVGAAGGIRGRAAAGWTQGVGSYASSIDAALADLRVPWTRNVGFARVVPLLLIHGWSETSTFVSLPVRRAWADRGFLVLVPEMRGRNGSDGDEDGGGREIHDLLDAVAWARATLPGVDPERLVVSGYSGGGGNALALACKAPDACSYITAHFPISDYDAWYTENAVERANMDAWIGDHDDEEIVDTAYRARRSREAIATTLRYSDVERLRLYHDDADGTVSVNHSREVAAALSSAGIPHTYLETGSGDPIRATHEDPTTSSGVVALETQWWKRAANAKPWSLPIRGSARVIGWLRSKRFEIWLGSASNPRTNGEGGKTRVADVSWDTSTGEYTVTPLNGTTTVQIVQGSMGVEDEISSTTVLEAA